MHAPRWIASMTTERESQAQALAKRWPVLPLHTIIDGGKCSCRKSNCASPGKHPRNHNGLSGASRSPVQIGQWWREWPDASVGIATGEAANLTVLDVDPAHGGMESLASLGEMPDTLTVTTGSGGLHFYFAYNPALRQTQGLLPGLDVRNDGGYVVAPGMPHASGGTYVVRD